ncbi:hypothetical protein PAMP_007568 [Pampus punctatissimus]
MSKQYSEQPNALAPVKVYDVLAIKEQANFFHKNRLVVDILTKKHLQKTGALKDSSKVDMELDTDVFAKARANMRLAETLFNSSSMNSIDNEITQIGSELITHFGDTEHAKQVADNWVFLDQALNYEQGMVSMLRMRGEILAISIQ